MPILETTNTITLDPIMPTQAQSSNGFLRMGESNTHSNESFEAVEMARLLDRTPSLDDVEFINTLPIPAAWYNSAGLCMMANTAWAETPLLQHISALNLEDVNALTQAFEQVKKGFNASVPGLLLASMYGGSDNLTAVSVASELSSSSSFTNHAILQGKTLRISPKFHPETNAITLLLWFANAPAQLDGHAQTLICERVCGRLSANVLYVGLDGCYVYVNEHIISSAGVGYDQFIGKHYSAFLTMDTPSSRGAHALIECALVGQQAQYLRQRYDVGLSQMRWFLSEAVPDFDAQGKQQGIYIFAIDVTAQKQAEINSRRFLRRMASYIDNSLVGAIEYDDKFTLIWASKSAERIFDTKTSDVKGKSALESGFLLAENVEKSRKNLNHLLLQKDGSNYYNRTQNQRSDGKKIWCDWYNTVLVDEQTSKRSILSLVIDVSDVVAAREALTRAATHDQLTQLPSRFALKALLDTSPKNTWNTYFLIDLDGFKDINDTYGHDIGDLFLVSMSTRLSAALNNGEYAARLGGDEFLVCSVHMLSNAESMARANEIIATIRTPVLSEGLNLRVSASIGIYHSQTAQDHGWDMIRYSDLAMYAAKAAGKNQACVYQPEMSAHQVRRTQLIEAMREGLAAGAFEVWYQPKISLLDGAIIGAEALLRWRDPNGWLISPTEFIPLAEETGLIHTLGEFVLGQACQFARKINLKRTEQAQQLQPSLIVAVNVSALQIQNEGFTAHVAQALAMNQCPSSYLELEVTESVQLSNSHSVHILNNMVSKIGVSCSIDDFGTGYSNLKQLQNIAASSIKIDRSFIAGLLTGDYKLVAAMHQLAHSLGKTVVAEGVETQAQLAILKDMGCDSYQGFLTSPALNESEFMAFLSNYVPKTTTKDAQHALAL